MAKPEDRENKPSGVEDGEGEQKYRYVSVAEVTEAFEHFRYGPSKRYVDAVYVSEDGKHAVGVLRVTEAHCEGHFEGEPILRGVDQIEAFAQTYLLGQYALGRIPQELGPLFAEAHASFKNPVKPGAILNMYVEQVDAGQSGNVFSAKGKTLSGDVLISEMEISGAMLPTALLPRLIARSARQQAGTPPKFPIRQ